MFFRSKSETEKRTMNLGSGSNSFSLAMVNGQLQPVANGMNAGEAIKNSDVFSCINLISSDVASAAFKINMQDDNLNYLLSVHPNNLYSPYQFWQTVLVNLLLNGNTFVVIWRDPATGMPTKLELLINLEVNLRLADDGQDIFYDINFFDSRPGTTVEAKDMLHFRLLATNLSTQYEVMGTSPLLALADEAMISKQSNKLTISALMNTLNPTGFITVPGQIDKTKKENIRNSFIEQSSGDNSGKPIVLDQTAKYDTAHVDPNILKLLDGVTYSKKQIAKCFGIPSDMLEMESEHSNIQQIMSFYAACLNRYIFPITSEITNKLCDIPGEKVTMDASAITDPDNSLFQTRMCNLVKNGVITPDYATSILQQKGGW